MSYSYIIIDKKTNAPLVAGDKKYHLTHSLKTGKINPDEVTFWRVTAARWPELSKVTQLKLEGDNELVDV